MDATRALCVPVEKTATNDPRASMVIIPAGRRSAVGRLVFRRRIFEELRTSGKPPKLREDSARRESGAAQFPPGRGQLALIAGMFARGDGGHPAFDPGGNHLGFVFARECLSDGLFGERGRDPAAPKIAQNAGAPETVAFHTQGSEHFSEPFIVEVAN